MEVNVINTVKREKRVHYRSQLQTDRMSDIDFTEEFQDTTIRDGGPHSLYETLHPFSLRNFRL